jgi:hypothetical protein
MSTRTSWFTDRAPTLSACALAAAIAAVVVPVPAHAEPGSSSSSAPQPAADAERNTSAAANPLVGEDEAPPANTSLTPESLDRLRRQVLAQCGLPENSSTLPWYFHFEFGRALLASGDPRRAVAELSLAVEINPVPHAAKRMYGMWYVDYFPYYQLAIAQSQLGNWTCAANAMRLSQLTEAATAEHFDMVKYANLRRQIEGKAPYTEACHPDDR